MWPLPTLTFTLAIVGTAVAPVLAMPSKQDMTMTHVFVRAVPNDDLLWRRK